MTGRYPIIRPVDLAQDCTALRMFLDADDQRRLDTIHPAITRGDAFVLVADAGVSAIGWVVVHLRFRGDMGWEPDGDTVRFQSGENAYLENLSVAPELRGKGIGRGLLAAAELEAAHRGKCVLWLHCSEGNTGAHRFYEREGWTHHATVYPSWRNGAAMWVYRKPVVR